MGANKTGKLNTILSLATTSLLILILFFAASASAVKISLQADKSLYGKGSTQVLITGSIDIQKYEIVPFSGLTLKINDEWVCEFDVNVNGVSPTCPYMSIVWLNQGNEAYGNLNGDDTNFGFGYGFSEEKSKTGMKGELTYQITWDIVSDDVPYGKYEAIIEALAEENGIEHVYQTSRADSFNIQIHPEVKAVVTKVKASSSKGNIISLNDYEDLNKEKITFSMNLRESKKLNTANYDGKLSLSLTAQNDDWTTLKLKMSLDDYVVTKFTEDEVTLTAKGIYQYTQTNSRNSEFKENTRGTEDVSVTIKDGKAFITSSGEVPFSVSISLSSLSFN